MAFRLMTRALQSRAAHMPQLKVAQPTSKNIGQIRNGCVFCKPAVPYLEKPSIVFSKKALRHHWGAIPIIVFTVIGFSMEVLYTIRVAVTRDDVWYTKNPAACEIVETRKGYPAPIRKMLVINQKYETPPELIEALQGNTAGPSNDMPKAEGEGKGLGTKAVVAHAVLTAGALGLAMATGS